MPGFIQRHRRPLLPFPPWPPSAPPSPPIFHRHLRLHLRPAPPQPLLLANARPSPRPPPSTPPSEAASLLTAAARARDLRLGRALHARLLRTGTLLESDS